MLGQFAWQEQPKNHLQLVSLVTALISSDTACLASSPGRSNLLNFPRGDGGPFVVIGETAGLGRSNLTAVWLLNFPRGDGGPLVVIGETAGLDRSNLTAVRLLDFARGDGGPLVVMGETTGFGWIWFHVALK